MLWGGNNENEVGLNGWFSETSTNNFLYVSDYVKLYVDTIYPIIQKLDFQKIWVDSSPSNGLISSDPYAKRWGEPGDKNYGDMHYYDYSVDCEDYSKFPGSRFISEFGYQSWPSMESMQEVSREEDWSR